MKKGIIIFFVAAAMGLSFTFYNNYKDDKSQFLGSWTGSEQDNQTIGLTKHWIQNRYKDGTFVLIFTTVQDCEVDHLYEKGKWWLKDGLFYELHADGKTDVYSYEILEENKIKFKAKELSIDHDNESYEFIDTKLEEEK